ncbi:hypothetical protein [Pseudomonas yamanorum]|uniref:Uncharacterized protein n=3 Tax=Pseudomonas TaxID=286 RepID=A0A7Y8EIP0_9PSED|nr:hypothetical protein [Pseudomonas yamanorum]NWE15384.1 hypothetical protein [Pseudomonas yamanorum]NWE78042.1 hypothetical protein [Pseudomonas yamanorum]
MKEWNMVCSVSSGTVRMINIKDNELWHVPSSAKSSQEFIPASNASGVRDSGNVSWADVLTSLHTIVRWLRELLDRDVLTTDKNTVTPDAEPPVKVIPDKQVPLDTPKPVMPDSPADFFLRKNGGKPKDIVNAFTATAPGFGDNFDVSTHAAVIKMMMLKFGQSPADVFDEVKRSTTGYDITMKDGFTVHVAHDELTRATRAARFGGGDEGAIRDASFIFATFVKRKQMETLELRADASFDEALTKTLSGEFPKRALEGMGMTGFMQYVPSSFLRGKDTVGLAETRYLGASLVLDGVRYNYQARERLGDSYGYRLTGDETLSDELLVDPRKGTVQVSSVPVGVKPENIWAGFYQGVEGNCVTVSAMKAAMMKLGQSPAGIYKRISATGDGYAVVMRDGFKLRITHEELKKAEQHSNLNGTDKVLVKDANFLYAVSAKRAQLENHEGRAGQSFETAMETLNNGELPGDGFRRLGLYAYTRPSTVQELAGGVLGTLANFQHSVVVVNGDIDLYGYKESLLSSTWNNKSGYAVKLV